LYFFQNNIKIGQFTYNYFDSPIKLAELIITQNNKKKKIQPNRNLC